MKRATISRLIGILAACFCAPGYAIALEPMDAVDKAIQKLSEQQNYSWTSVRKSAGEDEASVKGKINKDGQSELTIEMAGRSVEGVIVGKKGALKTTEGWKSTADFTGDGGSPASNPMTFLARHLSSFGKSPADQAAGLLKKTKALNRDEADIYVAELTEAGVKENVPRFGVEVSNPSGSVKYWVKDGTLVKYSYTVRANVKFLQQNCEVDYDRTTTVEIKDVGATQVELPKDALAKIE
jgi:hypothetical protein